ncbi:MAG: L-glutamate gamma-semialdehyde dehydrogenase [Candidatus Stahlbacteria bacterium]|nr:L-glutamate gamma-semialdehyde dehydrogenase [Candidatus Stahlbacteria bacterium]
MVISEFKNEPLTDFSIPENKKKMELALNKVKGELSNEYPLIIGNKRIKTDAKFYSHNPANKKEIVGSVQQPSEQEIEKAIKVALDTFNTWKYTDANERAGYLFKAASIVRNRKFELSSWLIYEVGKSWVEADADVAETIDFLEFYGREAIRYSNPQPLTSIIGEANELKYIPLGMGLIIAPWNFPLAILAGMTSAALVTGNTVIMKPSSDSPVIAYKFMEILEEAGLPAGVVNFLPGRGGTIGDGLVLHPNTRFIAFTGSMEVGLRINELASKSQDGQIWIKRVIAEMGGKNAIIVDESADLEAAATGIIASAFGYQGQKCSACSRAIVHQAIYDKLIDKLIEKVKNIKVGDPADPNNYMGPVINEWAFRAIMEYIEIGKKEGQLIYGGNGSATTGYFIEPTIIRDIESNDRIAQEEIFGPVLAIIKAKDFDHALQIANNTKYGLTGAVYTKNRKYVELTKQSFHCGNLYFNRKCTGAFVGVHPFGGFNMSGTDSKAGGRDYLLLFLQAKLMSEANIVA